MGMIPDRLINFKAYSDSGVLLGLVDVELPTIKMLTEKMSGAGIAGELDVPGMGQFGAMQLKLKFRAATHAAVGLTSPRGHHIELRGSMQFHESGSGTLVPRPIRVVTRALPTEFNLGKFEPNKPMDSEITFELSYLALFIDEVPKLEIDKLNHRWTVNGDDPYALIAVHLGAG